MVVVIAVLSLCVGPSFASVVTTKQGESVQKVISDNPHNTDMPPRGQMNLPHKSPLLVVPLGTKPTLLRIGINPIPHHVGVTHAHHVIIPAQQRHYLTHSGGRHNLPLLVTQILVQEHQQRRTTTTTILIARPPPPPPRRQHRPNKTLRRLKNRILQTQSPYPRVLAAQNVHVVRTVRVNHNVGIPPQQSPLVHVRGHFRIRAADGHVFDLHAVKT
mmetsp:Transcript_14489/g.18290  ORF Transcript_14489/g.18290 Transcript_14489/m.18290 type:complete len:216 (+) Transcript_14489:58-705(+)